jgi:hypothetical protein
MGISRRGRRRLVGGGVCALTLLFVCSASAALPDERGWEMVSPIEKNGGRVDPPGTIAAGGDLQAAASGGLLTYSSATSFAGGAGAPLASQYIAVRSTSGWSTENITTPIFSGTYDFSDRGVPYRLFSSDLSRGLLLNGDRCRAESAAECPVANPPLAGTDAPAGYQDYYLREGGSFESLIDSADIAGRGLDPSGFEVSLEGAAADLSAVALSSCAALTNDAVGGCGEGKPNLYLWRRATGTLSLVSEAPGARLASSSGAVSPGGLRVYFEESEDGALELREGATIYPVSAGAAAFQAASDDGAVAYYTEGTHLYRYDAATHSSSDLTPAGGVVGVLGASTDGSTVYFQDTAALKRWSEGILTTVAAGAGAADPSTYPPPTGAARVSGDGTRLVFLSKAQLTGYVNTDKVTGLPDSEVFLYDATASGLKCLSCNPKGKRPIGPSTIPGAWTNGASFAAYKPRALSADGKRVFFDSADALVSGDSNSIPATGAGIRDVYQWEAQGEGSCTQPAGCLSVLSNGALPQGASFADASADGSDVFFLTEASLLPSDPGAGDVYDARVGGGFAAPPPQIPCEGDACQVLPAVPGDPSLATLAPGAGNPAVSYKKYCRKGYVKRKGICEKKGAGRRHAKRKHKQKDKGGKR